MTLIWLFQIALDIAVTVILLKYFVGRKYGFLGLRDLISKELSSKSRLNTPLGSATSTLSEKKNSLTQEAPNPSRVGLQIDTDSSLFGGTSNIKVRDAKRLLNQGITVQEVARRTGLSHAELVLLEKTMLGGLKDLS
jgi:hypothetical protein